MQPYLGLMQWSSIGDEAVPNGFPNTLMEVTMMAASTAQLLCSQVLITGRLHRDPVISMKPWNIYLPIPRRTIAG